MHILNYSEHNAIAQAKLNVSYKINIEYHTFLKIIYSILMFS